LRHDFTKEDPWRIFRIMSEFVEGFEELSDVKNAVSIFGSSRAKPADHHYKVAEEMSRLLVKNGYSVITGAGDGVMEAANKGAFEAKGESIGLNILIPIVQNPNKYINRLIEFKYFFCRKVMFAKYSEAFIVFPGGFGTMDEFFEAITLVQTKRIDPFPVVLMEREYWKGLLRWIKNTLLPYGTITKSDLNIFRVADTPKEALAIINRFYKKPRRGKH